jgi:hypothetical protein
MPSGSEIVGLTKGSVKADIVAVNGTGCGTGVISVSDDNSVISLISSDFLVTTGSSSSSKKCKAKVAVHAPAGHTYAVSKVTHRADVDIAAGAKGTLKTTVSFAGTSLKPVPVRTTLAGPVKERGKKIEMVVPEASRQYAPCTGDGVRTEVDFDTQVSLSAGSAVTLSSITVGDKVGPSEHELVWKRCPGA